MPYPQQEYRQGSDQGKSQGLGQNIFIGLQRTGEERQPDLFLPLQEYKSPDKEETKDRGITKDKEKQDFVHPGRGQEG